MKNFYKKFIGITLSICMTFSLSACGAESKNNDTIENVQESENTISPEEIVETAKQKLIEANSLECKFIESVKMRAGLETASMESIIDVILFDNPMKLKTNITETDISGNTEEMEWYIEKVEDNTIMYIEVLGDWYKQVVTEQYFFTKENLIAYIEPITELKQTGTEQINEKNTIRYDGVIKGNDIRKIAEAQSLLEIVEENLKDTNVSVDKVYQDIPDIPTFICIDEQGYIAKLELDLEDMIKSVSAKLAEQGNPDFDLEGLSMNVKLSFTCQNFNNATNFEIPEEARNGQEV